MKIGDKVSVWGGEYVGIITAKDVGGVKNMYAVTSKVKWPDEYVHNSYTALFFKSDITVLTDSEDANGSVS